jgi:hypothetical protein
MKVLKTQTLAELFLMTLIAAEEVFEARKGAGSFVVVSPGVQRISEITRPLTS